MKRFLLWFLVVVLVVGALVFGKLFPDANSTLVDIDLLWVRVPNVEAWLLLTASMLFGGLLATLVVGFAWLKARVLNRRYRKAIKRLEAELHQMRSLPLSTGDGGFGRGTPASTARKGKGLFGRRASADATPEQAPKEAPAQGVARIAEGRG